MTSEKSIATDSALGREIERLASEVHDVWIARPKLNEATDLLRPYHELPEVVKDMDRVTVLAVFNNISGRGLVALAWHVLRRWSDEHPLR